MSLTQVFPSVDLAHKPTPLERLNNLSADLGIELWIKRDNCTGLAFGGNKTILYLHTVGAPALFGDPELVD